MKTARYWIDRLQLERHPEGGWYRETFRSSLILPSLPAPYSGTRVASTDIYFLLEASDRSTLHRLRSEERWHFHWGGPMTIFAIYPDGGRAELRPDQAPDAGQQFQVGVPAGTIFGALVDPSSDPERDFALVSCTVAPGFEFEDFELCDKGELLASFPQHRELIERLGR